MSDAYDPAEVMSRHLSKSNAIQNVLDRLGYHARPSDVVAALAEYGIELNERLVQKVKIEIRKDAGGIRRQQAAVRQVVPDRQVRRVQKVPGQR